MPIFSFHLAKTTLATTATALLRPPTPSRVAGLRRVECMTVMALGSPILSSARFQSRNLAVFASWDDEHALDRFLADDSLGRALAAGWHVRMEFLRRWGRVSGFDDLPANVGHEDAAAPVVAVTLARLKLPEVPRFIRWGKPVEELVRDHPATTLALAAMRPPRTVSTFSVWRSLREMSDMVRGRDSVPGARRHAEAMVERNRRDFHHQFTTLRFRPLAEQGSWSGRTDICRGPDDRHKHPGPGRAPTRTARRRLRRLRAWQSGARLRGRTGPRGAPGCGKGGGGGAEGNVRCGRGAGAGGPALSYPGSADQDRVLADRVCRSHIQERLAVR